MLSNLIPKLNLGKQTTWDHHRSGWTYVINLIKENFHIDDGIDFFGAVEDEIVAGRKFLRPWVGFIHQVPRHDLWFPDLERLLANEIWKFNLTTCKGLFVLSEYVRDYLIENNVSVPINKLFYPSPVEGKAFDYSKFIGDKKIIHSGEFLRNYQAFFDIKASGYKKLFLQPQDFEKTRYNIGPDTSIIKRVDNDAYDSLLQESIVFLNLFDAPANTVIVECIVRNTPVLVNKLPGVVEYLGAEYPFYYDNLEEATNKIANDQLIKDVQLYLKTAKIKPKLQESSFIDSLRNSAIYRSLPIPRSLTPEFSQFDLSIIICSYKRTYNLPSILERLKEQQYDGSFEIIIWNNNIETHSELYQIYEKFKSELNIKLINSTENFYCVIRLGVPSIMKSEVMLICDDDVLPNENYVAYFMEKYKKYGRSSAICLRGHKFYPHKLNESNPEEAWFNNKDIVFYDETIDDMQIHYAHADNLLISKHLIREINKFQMDDYDQILIDDYWFSYILVAKLNVPIWKVSGREIMQFTECESDPSIALYQNHKVRDRLLSFYIQHMRNGWPFDLDRQALSPREFDQDELSSTMS